MTMNECPFKGYANITCDYMGIKPEEGIIQCPTQLFNKCQGCQEDISFNEDDQKIIKETLNILIK